MKKLIFGLLAASAVIGFNSCNSSGNNTGSNDSTSTSTTTTKTSTHNYAALSDSFKTNSKAGYYIDPRTGKALNLIIDTSSGTITDENGNAVKRYVDKRTWWVYDANSMDTIGSARFNNGNLLYEGTNGEWVPYSQRWPDSASASNNAETSDTASSKMTEATGTIDHSKTKIKSSAHKTKIVTKDKE